MLPPGLYGMVITERKGRDGRTEYEVEFREHRLEEIIARLNRLKRADEKPFEAVAELSEFNHRAYELFVQPLIQSLSNEYTARLLRDFHPLRFQRWGISDANPWLAWLAPAAQFVKAQRQAVGADAPTRKIERMMSELISTSLDYYRAMRDALSEAAFFQTYGNMFSMYLADKYEMEERAAESITDPREMPFVKEALASIAEGGYVEAFARVAFLLSRKDDTLPLSRVVMRQELMKDYADLVPSLPLDQWRRIRGEQEIIALYEPEQALNTLPDLLADHADRKRLLTLLERLLADERVQQSRPAAGQIAMLERIRAVLGVKTAGGRRLAAVKKA